MVKKVALLAGVLIIVAGCSDDGSSASNATPTPPVTFQSTSPAADASPLALGEYALRASMPLYDRCVNLTQGLVTGDPKPTLLKRLGPGTRIVAFEPGWTQIGVNGDVYRYSRDEQSIRVRSGDAVGCIAVADSDTDSGDVRDAGFQSYIRTLVDSAKNNPQITRGNAPDSETADSLDSSQHFESVDALEASEAQQ